MRLTAIASLPSEKVLSLVKFYNVSGFILIHMIHAETLSKSKKIKIVL